MNVLSVLQVLLEATWDNETRRREYEFQDSIHYDDTDGYFVFGGSRFMSGIHGFFGPIRYYRLGTKEVKTHLEPLSAQLDQTLQECEDVKVLTRAFLQEVRESHVNTAGDQYNNHSHNAESCQHSRMVVCREKLLSELELGGSDETQSALSVPADSTGRHQNRLSGGKAAQELLFEEALVSMFSEDQNGITSESSSKSSSFLRASSCFGNHRASLLLAALLLSGLGNPVHQTQGQVYSLISAAGDNRFALMHAGYKHSQGIDGFPRDLEAAYSYYSNVGAQSSVDRERMHRQLEHTVEHVYLSPVEGLQSLSHQNTDLFQFVKYQAESGDVDSQRLLGTMLFWGQHGVTKDLQSAVKWLERSALQGGDPAAMYDYSILLMKGQGVRRNHSRGGSVSALNGLGWYYGMVLQDHRKALSFFQQAALNGSEEAMFNLGIYHLNGSSPAVPERLAARPRCSVCGGVLVPLHRGGGAPGPGGGRDVCEQNGHLGFLIRDALQAFLRDAKKEAFLKFLLAAETGLGSAQSNTAHLCEDLQLGAECQWRYNNLSVVNYDPHPSALLAMGDLLLSSSSVGGADSALLMYGRAAAAGSPQGLVLPQGVLSLMNLTQRGVQLDLLHRISSVGSGSSEMDLKLRGDAEPQNLTWGYL
ncbi:Protein sel-1 like 3 [Dissostichus eleginoides]|uniref:Protein sel-1 like 3 n=1 Tax=Dissostichus eleginoides TaxID=100907 RepID=A0AAD9C8N6_DISEL|nr:Protein sel-1 like 3 [Dissostichus eleginoides]